MGQISIQTPQGIKHGTIAGDSPTDEEMEKIRNLFPAEPGDEFEYKVVGTPRLVEEVEEVEEEDTAPTEEVKSNLLRYSVGRMDTPEEKENLLRQILGPDAVRQDEVGSFIIDQAKVAPELRQKYNLSESGEIYFDRPGFTWKDVVDFGGEARPSTIAAIGTSLAATGFGWIPGALMVGGAAALAKAIDESIEYAQGLNRQSAGDVATMIATEGALNATFEVGGRAFAYGVGRLIKGRGPEVSQDQVDKFIAAGMSKDRAFRAAREESLARMRSAVMAGARPTVEAAGGKSLAARAQSINEKIVPNKQVGRDNVGYINSVLKDLDAGVLSEEEALKLLADNDVFIGNTVKQALSDPDEALKLSRQPFDDIVSQELKQYERIFVPGERLPTQYVDNLELSAALFKTESNNLYDLSRATLGENANFSTKKITDTLARLQNPKTGNPFITYSGTLFKKLQEDQYANMNITQLQQLKSALRLSAGDPDLVAPAAQQGVKELIKSVDEVLEAEKIRLGKIASAGHVLKYHPTGAVDPKTGQKIGGRAYRQEVAPAELESIRYGLSQWDEANKFWAEGQEQFNNKAVNSIVEKARGKYFNSNLDVMNEVVEAGNVPKLKMYLDAVTPSSVLAQKLVQPGATEALERLQTLVGRGKFKEAERLIDNSILKGVVPKIEGFIEDLPIGDVLRVSQREAYEKQIDRFLQLSIAGAKPQLIRDSVRNSLAKEWLETKSLQSQTTGQFDPTKFADEFSRLGDDMQNTLFGSETAASMRESMDAFRLVGLSAKDSDKLFEFIPNIGNQTLKQHVQGLKQITDKALDESSDAVLGAIKTGSIDNSSKLVAGLLDNPSSYNRLKGVVGETELEKVGGVKDMVMNNLVRSSLAREGFSEATIQSGAWGKALKKNIVSQNKNGALNTILGKDIVDSLTRLSDDAIKVSDAPIAGYSGIAGPLAALSILAALGTFHIGAAVSALGGAFEIGRTLRSRPVLRMLTSSAVRSREYNQAIKAGSDLPELGQVYKSDPITYGANRLASIASSELSLILGSGILGEISEEGQRQTATYMQEGVKELQRRRRPAERPASLITDPITLKDPLSYEQIIRSAVQSGNVPGSTDVLRRIEEEKLRGDMAR